MTWRLHLTNRAIQSVDIVGDVLAVWSRRNRVAFYDLATGAALGETLLEFPEDRASDDWQTFLSRLKTPRDAPLPFIQTPTTTIYTTSDGRMHLYHQTDHKLYLESAGREVPLDTAGSEGFVALALDRFLALSVALSQEGRLYVYQQHMRVGAFDIGLMLRDDLRPMVAIADGGGVIFVTDGERLLLTDSAGTVSKQVETYYHLRHLTCSPDGAYVATCDMDAGVIRIYNGADLAMSHQRFAIDLMMEATQVQLLADMPPNFVAPNALAVNNDGVIAFAMSGVICVSDLEHMNDLPRPQTLL